MGRTKGAKNKATIEAEKKKNEVIEEKKTRRNIKIKGYANVVVSTTNTTIGVPKNIREFMNVKKGQKAVYELDSDEMLTLRFVKI